MVASPKLGYLIYHLEPTFKTAELGPVTHKTRIPNSHCQIVRRIVYMVRVGTIVRETLKLNGTNYVL